MSIKSALKLAQKGAAAVGKVASKITGTQAKIAAGVGAVVATGAAIGTAAKDIKDSVGAVGNLINGSAAGNVGGLVGDPPMNFFESFLSSTTSGIILRNEAFEMVLNQKMTEIINDLNVDRLKIGLRPSDILVSMAPKENFFPAEVYVVEPLGMIQILTLAQQKIKFQVKYSGSLNFEMKQRVYFGFQPDKLHYFHPTTGLNVLLKEE